MNMNGIYVDERQRAEAEENSELILLYIKVREQKWSNLDTPEAYRSNVFKITYKNDP